MKPSELIRLKRMKYCLAKSEMPKKDSPSGPGGVIHVWERYIFGRVDSWVSSVCRFLSDFKKFIIKMIHVGTLEK